jgi:HEAT repeat protein
MIVVAHCAVGLMTYRVYVERAPVYRLIGQLRTGNAQARGQATVQLGLMGPKAAFAERALTSALDDPDPSVRTEATYALVAISSRSNRLVRALVAELEKWPRRNPLMMRSWRPGHDPVAALKAIRPDAAVIVPILDRALNGPNPFVRRSALDVLCAVAGWSDLTSPEVDEALVAALADESFDSRKQAVEALAKRGRPAQRRAVTRLAEDLRDLDSVRSFESAPLLPLLMDGTSTAATARRPPSG